MYVVVQHRIKDPEAAFTRGEKLIKNEGAPGRRAGPAVLPEHGRVRRDVPVGGPSVEAIQAYVDSTLGDSSENTCYEVDAEQAFSERPLGLPASAAIGA